MSDTLFIFTIVLLCAVILDYLLSSAESVSKTSYKWKEAVGISVHVEVFSVRLS